MTAGRRLISADSHVNPPPDFWERYLPERFRDRAPRIERTDAGDFQVFEGNRSPVLALSSQAGREREQFTFAHERWEDQRPGGWDPSPRLEDMDADGVDAEVIYGGGPLRTADRELHFASHLAYNDWLADFCSHDPKRLLGVAYIPFESVDAAVAEVRRAHARGLRSTLIQSKPPFGRWSDPEWAPLWEALVETGMPAGLHVGFSFPREMRFQDPAGFLTDLVMTKVEMAEPIAELVFSGVLERYPELRVISVEAYAGWLAFVAEYVDHAWETHRGWLDLALARRPSEYIRSQVYATFIEDPVAVRERHTIGVDNLMWSSDYPHGESTWPRSRECVERFFAGVPEEDTHKIVYANAKRLYSI
jgi:predicted TIM-barrel fold metal-dependent hydrolase